MNQSETEQVFYQIVFAVNGKASLTKFSVSLMDCLRKEKSFTDAI